MKQFEQLCSKYIYKIDTSCLQQGIESTGNKELADQYKKLGKIVKKRKQERNKKREKKKKAKKKMRIMRN